MSRRLELEELLREYIATAAEVHDLAAMRALAATTNDVLSATCFAPGHFTVSAFITDPEVESTVLIHHRRLDRWLQPGGHVEPEDATLLVALRREIVEETGISHVAPDRPPLFDVDVHPIPARDPEPAHRHFDIRFHVIAERAALAPSDEVRDAAWVDLDAVAAWTEDLSVLRAVEKLIGRRAQRR
jgi:8-oxo-dGTP pyrophosphatase MutT (NUDIX family)